MNSLKDAATRQHHRNRSGEPDLSTAYDHVRQSLVRMNAYADPAVWIHRATPDQIDAQWRTIVHRVEAGERLPLLGMTAGVKDNIDVAGMPTTCACAAFARTPATSATVVQKLCDAGAVVMGKTNLDQFATGLVGTRSPHGAPRNVYDPRYISGGSSSGSAVAVAAGLVDVALGTDTAGSGRVPAAFNNLIGLKPTKGLLSTAGVFPACRSLDCVSIFARDVETARRVFDITQGFDPTDIYSRRTPPSPSPGNPGEGRGEGRSFINPPRLGIPSDAQLEFFGNREVERLYRSSIGTWKELGAEFVTIDYSPFRDAARLLYEGPWVAERYAAVRELIEHDPDALLPVTRQIIGQATKFSAVDAFEANYRLLELRRAADEEFAKIDALLLPTAGTIYTIDEVAADPIRLNTNLGCYTNFVNLLDLCVIAIPAGFQNNRLPAGVSLVAPAGADAWLMDLAEQFLSTEAS